MRPDQLWPTAVMMMMMMILLLLFAFTLKSHEQGAGMLFSPWQRRQKIIYDTLATPAI
jgi:hypothetical protein